MNEFFEWFKANARLFAILRNGYIRTVAEGFCPLAAYYKSIYPKSEVENTSICQKICILNFLRSDRDDVIAAADYSAEKLNSERRKIRNLFTAAIMAQPK